MNANQIRNNIADLIALPIEERKQLDNVSITSLIENLIDYTRELERQSKIMTEQKEYDKEHTNIILKRILENIEKEMSEHPITITKVDSTWEGLYKAHEIVLTEFHKV